MTNSQESRPDQNPDMTSGESSGRDCPFVSAAGFRCHRAAGHDGGHKPYPIDWDLPADLADVLRDQSVIVPQDAAVWALSRPEGDS